MNIRELFVILLELECKLDLLFPLSWCVAGLELFIGGVNDELDETDEVDEETDEL